MMRMSAKRNAMEVLFVEPCKPPRVIEIPRGLSPLQEAVGGPIEAIYPFDDPIVLICNEEAYFRELPYNRRVCPGCIIRGAFLVCSVNGEHFDSLPKEYIEKYKERF